MKTQVRNLESTRGNKVANQFEVKTDKGLFFQSYNSVIAFIPCDCSPIQLDKKYWDYSKTTGKYRNLFLGENKAETLKKIEQGIYILTDLN